MKLKKIWIILTVILMLAVLGFSTYSSVYAENTDNELNLGVVLFRQNSLGENGKGYGYTVGQTDMTSENTKKIWKLVS